MAVLLLVGFGQVDARAQGAGSDCRSAALLSEQQNGLPSGLLLAIGRAETGRVDPGTGRFDPWPWSTNMAGVSHYFSSYAEAIGWSAGQLANGQRSIDVGCFQVNLMHHPHAFATLEEAFDPTANARYATQFLLELYRRSGSWQLAAAQYHSSDPAVGTPYGNRVLALLGAPDTPSEAASVAALPRFGGGVRVASFGYGIAVLVPSWARSASAPPNGRVTVTSAGVYVAMPTSAGEPPRLTSWPPVLPVVLRSLPQQGERRLPKVITLEPKN